MLELMMHGRACHKKLQSTTKQFFKRIQDESEHSALQKHVVYTRSNDNTNCTRITNDQLTLYIFQKAKQPTRSQDRTRTFNQKSLNGFNLYDTPAVRGAVDVFCGFSGDEEWTSDIRQQPTRSSNTSSATEAGWEVVS